MRASQLLLFELFYFLNFCIYVTPFPSKLSVILAKHLIKHILRYSALPPGKELPLAIAIL